MFGSVTMAHIPRITEPAPEARFREELANERLASSHDAESITEPVDTDLLLASQVSRLAGFVRFN